MAKQEKKFSTINIRISEKDKDDLSKVAGNMGIPLSSLVRMLTLQRLNKVRENGDVQTFLHERGK